MKKLVLLILLSSLTASGQKIKGIVLDNQSLQPLQGVHIVLQMTTLGITGSSGEFVIQTRGIDKRDTLHFSFLGYKTAELTIPQLEEMEYVVKLDPVSENLREINLSSERKLKQKISFRKLAPLEMEVFSTGSVMVGDKIYVAAGDRSFVEDPILKEMSYNVDLKLEDIIQASHENFTWVSYYDKLQIYDITNDTWEVADLELRRRAHHNLNSIGNRLYVIGGTRIALNGKREYLQDKIEVIDLESDSLIVDDVNPHQAYASASFTHKDNIIVLGGSVETKKNGRKSFSNKVHLFNPASGLWYEMREMPKGKETQGTLIGDEIFLVGGFDGKALAGIERMNVYTGKWVKEADLPSPMKDPAVASHGKTIYILQGSRIFTYHIETKELEEFKIDLDLYGAEMHFRNDKLYIIGGYRENEFSKKAVRGCYSIELQEFLTTRSENHLL